MKDPWVPRYFLWFVTGTFCFSPEEEPLSLMRMQTQCCRCEISGSLSSWTVFLKVFRAKSGPWFFPYVLSGWNLIRVSSPSLLVVVIIKISIREGRKINFIFRVKLGQAESYSQWVFPWAAAASLLPKYSLLGLWQKLWVRMVCPSDFSGAIQQTQTNPILAAVSILMDFDFYWFLSALELVI